MLRKLIALAVATALFAGCDVFDTGDTEKVFDMDPQVELKPLQNQTSLADGGTSVAVQLIGEQRSDNLNVEYSIDAESTAEEGVHYEIVTPSPVTIESGTSATDIVIEYIEDSVDPGEELRLIINLDGTDAEDVEPAGNLSTSTTFISN
ncbi:hypothetical protein [Rhodohalobacter halophilus]|uniref:hypothetical protein n=1 Tax=Rhodohalobacter halophilus TaxID=1812810 RepID=UPI00083FC387|nr:hypothetical protein [Rhodohalobacter halophilus]